MANQSIQRGWTEIDNMLSEGYEEACSLFDQAVALDPANVRTHAGVA